MCLVTKGPSGESIREAAGENRFVKAGYPTDFTNARITLRLRGELEAAGTKFSVLIQGSMDGLVSGWVLTGQTFEVTTGVPQAMASRGGRPKPSYCEGKTKTVARR